MYICDIVIILMVGWVNEVSSMYIVAETTHCELGDVLIEGVSFVLFLSIVLLYQLVSF